MFCLTGSSTKNNTIKNCIINDYQYGIHLYTSNGNYINYNVTNNTLVSCNNGIKIQSHHNNIIINNTFIGNSDGLFFVNANNNTIIDNIFSGNTLLSHFQHQLAKIIL